MREDDVWSRKNSTFAKPPFWWFLHSQKEEKMNTYTTLTGEKIDIGSLPAYLGRVPEALVKFYKEESTVNPGPPNPFKFAERSRQAMGLYSFLVSVAEAQSILHSGAGAIYRDCFYRLYIQRIEFEQKEKGKTDPNFKVICVNNLRYNPTRLLLDHFLDGWATKVQFAEAAGLSLRTIERAFESLFSRKKSPLTLAHLIRVFGNLGIVPSDVLSHIDTVKEIPEQLLSLGRQDATLRDRHLRAYIGLTAQIWHRTDTAEEARKNLSHDVLAHGLHLVYGAEGIALSRMADQIFGEITNQPIVVYTETEKSLSVYMGQLEESTPVITLPEKLREEVTKILSIDI